MMECTTGLTDDEFDGLLAWLREEGVEGYPPILGLSGSLRAALMYIRQNIVQAVIGEQLGVSQPTVPAGHQGDHGGDRPDSDGPSAHGRGGARGLRLRGGRHPLPLPGLARSPRSVVGQAQARGDERPDPGPARRKVRVGLRPLPGVHARRGRTRRLPDCWREWTPPGGSATRDTSAGG